MSVKKWLIAFFAAIILAASSLAVFNAIVDPFGVFGDPIFDWYSYSFTQNTRVAKFTFIDRNHEQFDSYILGASGSSAFCVNLLNDYLDANFFNFHFLGADMHNVEDTAQYLIENFTVENIIIGISITNGVYFDQDRQRDNPKMHSMHVSAAGGSRFTFWSRYLWMNPQYSFDKISAFRARTYLPGASDWFDISTGAFDKRGRAAARISCLDEYNITYPEFENFPFYNDVRMLQIENTLESLARIRDMCEAAGVNLIIIFNPLFYRHFDYFNRDDFNRFFTGLAEVIPFWDFSMNALSFDPRFFYDPTHFRQALGDMVLARIFDDSSVYIPDDFGVFVTPENALARALSLPYIEPLPPEANTIYLPILMYHHIDEDAINDMIVTPETFAVQMRALYENGFTAVTLQQLLDFVDLGIPLPERPVVITFDDGYLSVYEHAFPVLQRYGFNAIAFVIGEAVGTDTYKDTGFPTIPKFCFDQARAMAGVVDIQSHSYDMHQAYLLEEGRARENILRWYDEPEADYIAILREDHRRISELVLFEMGKPVIAIAYPHGAYDILSRVVLLDMGVRVTMGVRPGSNTIIMGMPQSLYGLNRFTVTNNTSIEELLEMIKY